MLYGLNSKQDNEENKFHQRVADQNIQGLEQRQEEIQHAKNGFIGMLAGIVVGGVVGWLFLGPAENLNKEKVIPVVRRPITVAKVQPNEPGGMEIENQDREIYHIVDNTPKTVSEVNVIPVPEVPQLMVEKNIEMVTEKNIETPSNIENLVESLEESNSLNEEKEIIKEQPKEGLKVADTNLKAISTNSKEKIAIPEKLKDIDVKLQKTINSASQNKATNTTEKEEKPMVAPVAKTVQATPGTWYAQIIASSSRKTVENLWSQLAAKHSFIKEYSHEIEEITATNGNTLYRLKIGAFNTRKEAETLNAKLKQNQISSIIKQN